MNRRTFIVAGLICLLALMFNVQPAFAHESITVGEYTLEIGWLEEPPVVGQQNAITVHVSTTSDEQPVEDVSGLTVTVSYGGQEKALSLHPLGEETPGQFAGQIVPTVPGQYTLKLGGTIGTTVVDAEVDPEEVQSADTLQFPSVETAAQSAGNWLNYLSLLIGLIALGVGMMALQKKP